MDTSGFDTIHAIPVGPPPPPATDLGGCNVSLQQQLSHGVSCSYGKTLDASLTKMTMYQRMRRCGPQMDVAAYLYAQEYTMWHVRATWTAPTILKMRHALALRNCPNLTRALSNGSAAVLFLNAGEKDARLRIDFASIKGRSEEWGPDTTLHARDLFAREDIGLSTGSFEVHVESRDSSLVLFKSKQ